MLVVEALAVPVYSHSVVLVRSRLGFACLVKNFLYERVIGVQRR